MRCSVLVTGTLHGFDLTNNTTLGVPFALSGALVEGAASMGYCLLERTNAVTKGTSLCVVGYCFRPSCD